MYCNKCGNKLDKDAKFCNKCGTPIKSNFERGSNAPFVSGEDNVKNKDSIKNKKKKPFNKSGILISILILVCIIVAGIAGYFGIGIMRKNFEVYLNESEQKAAEYTSLGRYSDEYSSLMNESREDVKGYNIFSFIDKRSRFDKLFKNVEELKTRVNEKKKQYEDFVNQIEKENRFVLGEYKDKYDTLKHKIEEAVESLDESNADSGVSDMETMLSDIKAYNEKQGKGYDAKLKEIAKEKGISKEEKSLINNSQKKIKVALEKTDYIEAEKVFNKFIKEKKKFDDIRKFENEVLPAYEKYVRDNFTESDKNNTDEFGYYRYKFIYVNDDEIPELAIEDVNAYGKVLTYDKEVVELDTSREGSYIERKNKIHAGNHRMSYGYIYDEIYSIKNGKYVIVDKGEAEAAEGDVNHSEPWTFYWNSKEVLEEEYTKLLNDAYNPDETLYIGGDVWSVKEAYKELKKEKRI